MILKDFKFQLTVVVMFNRLTRGHKSGYRIVIPSKMNGRTNGEARHLAEVESVGSPQYS